MLPPHLYYRQGLEAGVEPTALKKSQAERTRLESHGAFPLFTLGHLAHETGASYTYLREVVSRARDPYRSIEVPKKRGGARSISAPEPILMDVQHWILRQLLTQTDPHHCSYAYQPGMSIVACASQHIGAKWMLKLDLHDFFGSIEERDVYRVFRRTGYSKLLAFELSRITTRLEVHDRAPSTGVRLRIPAYTSALQGTLPQGAPTSGALANEAARRLDNLLHGFSTAHKLVYTRYSDDLIFSSSQAFSRPVVERLLPALSGLISAAGFTLHRSKTRIIPPGARRVVLGLLVDDSVRLLPEHRRLIEVHLRGCRDNGLANHALHRGFDSALTFINHLDGWISFALGVDRSRAHGWRLAFKEILTKEGLSTLPSLKP